MKKICHQCNKVFDHPTANDLFCEDCGSRLSELNSSKSDTAIPSSHIQQDNRIHKGDKINVGGDNFNAQSVDNRTVTTNIHNIQTIVDETKKVVRCEISGKMVVYVETATCPSCKRCVSLAYYSEEVRLCQDCHKKEYKISEAETKPQTATTAATHKPGIPPMMNTSSNHQANIPMEPIRGGGGGTGSKKWIFIALACLIAVGAFWFISGSSDKSASTEKVQPVMAQEQSPSPEAQTATPQTPPVAQPESKKQETTPPAAKAKSSQTAATENKDPFTLGKQAFDAGNYTKAAVLLEQALANGKPGAAYYLALMHQQGKGVNKSVQKAFSYMKQSAESGYSAAYYAVAEMYRTGVGTETNRSQAKGWYEKAIAADTKDADKAATALNKYYR